MTEKGSENFTSSKTITRGFLLVGMLVVLLVFFLTLTGTLAQTESPEPVVDDFGTELHFEETPERIISLAPSITELLFALELGDRMVGVTNFCDYPPEALEVDTIGSITEPNIEAIVEKDPDLVVATGINPIDKIESLQELGVTVAGFQDPTTLDFTFELIDKAGRLTGRQATAKAVSTDMKERLDQILELTATREDETPLVFYEIWHDPLTTAGSNTYIDDLLNIIGAENLGARAGDGWPMFDLETLILEDPDVYITSPHDPQVDGEELLAQIAARENYDALTAVQQDRVHLIDEDKVNRPSPRIIDGLIELAGAVYPELAEELAGI